MTGDAKYLQLVPMHILNAGAIRDAYHDEDGYWMYLADGWKLKGYFSDHVIHEDTVAQLRKTIKLIVKE